MKNLSLIFITFFTLCVVFSTGMNSKQEFKLQREEKLIFIKDTIQKVDTITDVNGKMALFIGDSHTANHHWGWQIVLCDKTGLKMNNTAVGGKTTSWMVGVAKTSVTENFDYCFICGGANDMFGSVKATKAVSNIQQIVNMCNEKGVHAVVITGFNAKTCCITPDNPGYPSRYSQFQQMLVDSIKGAKVVDARSNVIRKDCGDAICHMNHSGHIKIAESVISQMKFKTKIK